MSDPSLFHSDISEGDRRQSESSLRLLRNLVTGHDRSLVFFIGAGASIAGNTGMPPTPAILAKLVSDALGHSGRFTNDRKLIRGALNSVARNPGFEITLNDFWQICGESVYSVFGALATLEKSCIPNRVHSFLADWLSTGGTVLTTNYDRLIEREWSKPGGDAMVRSSVTGNNSFETWRQDLRDGKYLFKLHGSLSDPRSCLGALEHVRTGLAGNRADLIKKVVRERPLCFVGWQGADPDIPPLLGELADRGSVGGPVFWVHYDGRDQKEQELTSLEDALRGVPEPLIGLASDHPILTEGDALFGEFLKWAGIPRERNSWRRPETLDFDDAFMSCPESGLARFGGIILRRAGLHNLASDALEAAVDLASTPGGRSAATQEIALLTSISNGEGAREGVIGLVEKASNELESKEDLLLALNADFGIVSNTVLLVKKRPWVLARLPFLFRRYRRHIDEVRRTQDSDESVSLHLALFNLYTGRLRLALLGWLGAVLGHVASWILHPFDTARQQIAQAKDIHVRSTIDVLSYRAAALARLGRCTDAMKDVAEIDRLIGLLGDHARMRHWKRQRAELQQRCQQDEVQ